LNTKNPRQGKSTTLLNLKTGRRPSKTGLLRDKLVLRLGARVSKNHLKEGRNRQNLPLGEERMRGIWSAAPEMFSEKKKEEREI